MANKNCPKCKEPMTPEEVAARECWSCGYDENPNRYETEGPSQEWDTDDDEAMPNVIAR